MTRACLRCEHSERQQEELHQQQLSPSNQGMGVASDGRTPIGQGSHQNPEGK